MEKEYSFEGAFRDCRNDGIANLMVQSMISKSTCVVHQMSDGRSGDVKFYRFVNNNGITREEMEESFYNHTYNEVSGREVLIIQDTCEFNFNAFREQFDENDPDLGTVGNGSDIGFFNHCSMVIDAKSSVPIGFSDIQLYNRSYHPEKKKSEVRRKIPIQEKESYRWIKAIEHSTEVCSKASRRWFVSDRESDIYAVYTCVHEPENYFVVRAAQNRIVQDKKGGQRLFDFIESKEIIGQYDLEVVDKKTQEKEVLAIGIKIGKVLINKPPDNTTYSTQSVELWFVEARSIGDKRVHWTLLTNKEVSTVEDALVVIERYKQRWHIEVFFGLLKSKGLNVELSQFTTGEGLKRICLLAMQAAMRINQLRLSFKSKDEKTQASAIFNKTEIKVLQRLNNRYEGKTEKQKNPFKKGSMAWAAWVVARMGGWKSYFSQADPGIATFTRGYMELYVICKYIDPM
jgi:hypothetical protein